MAIETASKTWMKDAGAKVRTRRKALKLTQRDLALLAGCHFVFVNELEKGKHTLRIDKVLDVLSAIGLQPVIPE